MQVLHRDLKSLNILLCSLDPAAPVVGKIADFGTSSIMFASSFREETKNRTVTNPTWLAPEVIKEQVRLLPSYICSYFHFLLLHLSRYSSSSIQGLTPASQGYSVSSDVYAFGIIMHEIWSRLHPFSEYAFMSEVEQAIIAGVRPGVPKGRLSPSLLFM